MMALFFKKGAIYMSAIWGIINFNNEMVASEQIEKFESVFKEKCILDSVNTLQNFSVYMGFGNQHVTGNSSSEDLPLYDDTNSFYLNADCILDNRSELLKLLNINDASVSDGYILKLCYQKYGIGFLNYIRGIYSISVFDRSDGTFYLASDHTACRSIYYYFKDNVVYFSTLIEPVIRACPDISINELYIKDFLMAPGLMPNTYPGDTPYTGVYQLKPAHYIKISNLTVSEHRYFDINAHTSDFNIKNIDDCKEKFMEVYNDCIASAINTDKNVAICLSSGFDSSSSAVLASLQLKKDNKNLYSYTYVPKETSEDTGISYHYFDETDDVLSLCSMYDNILPSFVSNNGKNCISELKSTQRLMEIPFKAVVNMPNLREIYRLSYKNNCRIVLSGQYGNSTVSYGNIESILYDLYENRRYITFYRYLNNYCKHVVPQSRKKALKNIVAHFKKIKSKTSSTLNLMCQNPFVKKEVFDNYPLSSRFKHIEEILQYAGYPDNKKRYLNSLNMYTPLMYIGAYETKLGLSEGIVVRDASRDIRMQIFCASVPYKYFAYNGNPRFFVRGFFKDLLPASYTNIWPRYGVQNSDWFSRIHRDHSQVYEIVKELCSYKNIDKYIDKELLLKFMESICDNSCLDNRENYAYMQEALNVLSLCYFLQF